MKNTTPGGIQTNVGGQNYDINYKSDLLATPNFAQMATHSLENSLRHSQDQMSQLGHQWGALSERAHNLSNGISSGQSSLSGVSSDEARSIQHAQALATKIGADISAGGKLFGSGITASGGVNSTMTDNLNNSLSEYRKISNDLSHSSNQEIRDAFSNTSTLTDTTSHTLQQAVSQSQALSDIKSNQTSVNTNLSNDYSNYLRSQGYEPTQMTATQQASQAQSFMENIVNPTYGIKSNLTEPKSTISENTRGQPRVDAQGLIRPEAISSNTVNTDKVDKAMQNFKDHQGNILGNQILEQGSTMHHMSGDAMDLVKRGFEKATNKFEGKEDKEQ